MSTWKRKAATLWLIPPAWEWDRDWYREQDWQNRKQWVLVPVSDQREHFYMTLYFAFGPCTVTGPFLVQCGYTIRGKHVETLLTLLNNRSNVDQQLNRIRKYVALNIFLILTAISPIFFWNWKLHQSFFFQNSITSQAYTLTSALSLAFIAAAIPRDKPPPPNGAIIVLTSGRSSRISSPIVALPIIYYILWISQTMDLSI